MKFRKAFSIASSNSVELIPVTCAEALNLKRLVVMAGKVGPGVGAGRPFPRVGMTEGWTVGISEGTVEGMEVGECDT